MLLFLLKKKKTKQTKKIKQKEKDKSKQKYCVRHDSKKFVFPSIRFMLIQAKQK